MSTRGHSTIDRIVSATLEEREREREIPLFFCPLPVLASSLLLPLPVPLALRARLFSRSFFERLSIDFPSLLPASVDESNATMCIARLFQAFGALFSSLLSMAVTSTPSLILLSLSLIRFLPVGRFKISKREKMNSMMSKIQVRRYYIQIL